MGPLTWKAGSPPGNGSRPLVGAKGGSPALDAAVLDEYTIFFRSVCFVGILGYRNALLTMAGGVSREDRQPSAQRHGGSRVARSGLSALLRAPIISKC